MQSKVRFSLMSRKLSKTDIYVKLFLHKCLFQSRVNGFKIYQCQSVTMIANKIESCWRNSPNQSASEGKSQSILHLDGKSEGEYKGPLLFQYKWKISTIKSVHFPPQMQWRKILLSSTYFCSRFQHLQPHIS